MLGRFRATIGLVLGLAASAPMVWADDNVTVRTDLDGDRVPDTISIVRVGDGRTPGTGEYAVRVALGNATYASKSYDALGPSRLAPKLPEPLQALQELPDGPLAIADLEGDGSLEVIAQLDLPMSRMRVLTLVLSYNVDTRELVTLFTSPSSDGVLCMSDDAPLRRLLVPWAWMPNGCPAFPNVYAHAGGKWARLPGGLPKRLAAPLAQIYASHNELFHLRAETWPLQEYVRALLASGDAERAERVVEDALWGLEEAEKQIPQARRDALLLRGQSRCALGRITDDEFGALQAFEDAFALDPVPGFETARGFALVEVCKTRMAAGDWEGANVWLTKAEEAEGQPGKFSKFRETIPLP